MNTQRLTARRMHTDSVFAADKAVNIDVELSGKNRRVHFTNIREDVDQYEECMSEKAASEKYRVILNIHPYCTNVLFNTLTEVSTYDGEYYTVKCGYDTTRDTTDSSKKNVTYMPGFDIFNNHLLRAKKDVVINGYKEGTVPQGYNTIEDVVRDPYGEDIKANQRRGVNNISKDEKVHVYTTDDLYHFYDSEAESYECFEQNIVDDNGWFGFANRSTLRTRLKDNTVITERKNTKVINNANACAMVDLYPDRTLFSFVPKYNKIAKREEYNWEILLAYPSEMYTDVPFIINGSGLAIIQSEKEESETGGDTIYYFRSEVRHNLNKGDEIKLFLFEDSAYKEIGGGEIPITVLNTGDRDGEHEEYIFSVKETWDNSVTIPATTELFEKCFKLAFCRVANGINCVYYIRRFKAITGLRKQNYRLAFSKNVYGEDVAQVVFTDDVDLSGLTDNFDRPVSDIYAIIVKTNNGYKKWYGAGITVSNAPQAITPEEGPNQGSENGEPTIDTGSQTATEDEDGPNDITSEDGVADGQTQQISGDEMFFSHCFGPVTCGVEGLNIPESDHGYNTSGVGMNKHNACDIRSIDCQSTLLEETDIMENVTSPTFTFPVDVVEYSPYDDRETSLADVCYRFNTFQREPVQINGKPVQNLDTVEYDEIESDDYDPVGFKCAQYSIETKPKKEGYYHKAGYRILLRQKSDVNRASRREIKIMSAQPFVDGDMKLTVRSMHSHKLNRGDRVRLIDCQNMDAPRHIDFTVTEVINKVRFVTYPKNGEWLWRSADGNPSEATTAAVLAGYFSSDEETLVNSLKKKIMDDGTNPDILLEELASGSYNSKELHDKFANDSDYIKLCYLTYNRLYVMDGGIPDYAIQLGTNTFVWRDVYPNGDIRATAIPERPFTSGATYVTQDINFFLRRQDPDGTTKLNDTENDPIPNIMGEILPETKYVYEENIEESC